MKVRHVPGRTAKNRIGGALLSKVSILKELWDFLKVRKRFWLLPIIIIFVLLGAFSLLAQTSAISPFIYSFF